MSATSAGRPGSAAEAEAEAEATARAAAARRRGRIVAAVVTARAGLGYSAGKQSSWTQTLRAPTTWHATLAKVIRSGLWGTSSFRETGEERTPSISTSPP